MKSVPRQPDSALPSISPNPVASMPTVRVDAQDGFRKVILRLVKGEAERRAIDAGQVDAILDPASGSAILLPQAQRALLDRKVGLRNLLGLAFDAHWEQDEQHRFVSYDGTKEAGQRLAADHPIGAFLWDLPTDNMSAEDWRTHRQQLTWRTPFRDLELHRHDANGAQRQFALSGEPVFDEQGQFKGYRGVTREITGHRQVESLLAQPRRHAHVTLDVLPNPVAMLDAAGTVLLTNRAWRALASTQDGIGAGVFEGASYLAACDEMQGAQRIDALALGAGIRQVLAGARERFDYDVDLATPAGRRWLVHSVSAVASDGAERAVVSLQDITEYKCALGLLELDLTVAHALAQDAGAAVAIPALIGAVCQSQGWDCGRHFSLDASTGLLCAGPSWGVPGTAVEQFLQASNAMVVRPGAGLAGRAYASGQPLWVIDGISAPAVSASALAAETGRGGAFVFPVTADGKVTGVLAFSGKGVCAPDGRMLQAVQSIGCQLGRYLQQQAALAALRQSEQRFRQLAELGSDWTWELDRQSRLTQLTGSHPFGTGDLLGKTLSEMANLVLDEAKWEAHLAQLQAHWSFCDVEFGVRHEDGRLGRYCISGAPLFDATGAFVGYCGTGLDITERWPAESSVSHESNGELAS